MGPGVADTIAFLEATGIGSSLLQDADPPTVARVTRPCCHRILVGQSSLEPYTRGHAPSGTGG